MFIQQGQNQPKEPMLRGKQIWQHFPGNNCCLTNRPRHSGRKQQHSPIVISSRGSGDPWGSARCFLLGASHAGAVRWWLVPESFRSLHHSHAWHPMLAVSRDLSRAGTLANGLFGLGFFTAWWLGSKGECPQRARWMLCCLILSHLRCDTASLPLQCTVRSTS